VKSIAPALLVVCLCLSLPAAARAAGSASSEDVPVRGGIAALADAIPISPAPDRARFLAEAIRVVYSWPQLGPYSNEPMRGRIAAFFSTASSAGIADDIPVPLTADVWSQVLRKQISREQLVGAILADRAASLLCYGLTGLDDDTLQFLADHAGLVSRLAERAPAMFAAFGESLRIRDGRVVVPGGDAARAAWESAVGEKVDRPERFVQQLFEADRGRVAYVFDLLSHVDRATTDLVFGTPGNDSLKRLVSLARRAFPEWEVATAPFVRPSSDLAAFFGRLRSVSDDEAGGVDLGTSAFWQRVFDEPATASGRTDVAWLAETILGRPARERERHLDVFSFTQRVFGSSSGNDDVIAAARGFGTYPVLMQTLERMGIRTPAVYVAAAQHAEKLTSLDSSRGAIALAQFQGALALLERMARVRTVDTATAEAFAQRLFSTRIEDGHYDGGVAAWLTALVERVRASTATAQTSSIDDVILAAAAGPQLGPGAPRLDWEGERYRVDPGAAELQRLRRTRARQDGVTFATALSLRDVVRTITTSTPAPDALHQTAQTLEAFATEIAAAEQSADEPAIRSLREAARTLASIRRAADAGDARHAVAPLGSIADSLLGHALVSLAYACDLGDPEGTILIAGDPSRRHDYGYDLAGRDGRVRAMWGIASIETRRGPWHLVGSALALDVAMAPLALRRISVDRVPDAPMLNLMHRDGFAAAVAIMNGAALSDADRDRIAEFIDRGRRRVDAVVAGREGADTLARDTDLDGWRSRALSWTVSHDPSHAASLFSLTELLVLGGGRPAAFNSWGTYGARTAGCLCSRLAQPGDWRRWWGLSQAGLPAILVADLPLNVALVLHNLHLPAVLAKPVLAAAMQDFVDGINPTDGNDWLTLARAAQAVDRTRFEDYVASAAADGPLVADSDEK
jgi:hypothetical protein